MIIADYYFLRYFVSNNNKQVNRIIVLPIVVFLILYLTTSSSGQGKNVHAVIDSLKSTLDKVPNGDEKVGILFAIADSYIQQDQYDTGQIWLNKIADLVTTKKPNIFNHTLTTRQAEVYYYSGLQRLGLQEAEKALRIAQALNDSFLIADSYNFLGLFYSNFGKKDKAIQFFKTAILFVKKPPYPTAYRNVSKPHHMTGNLAEAFYNVKQYDTALKYAQLSMNLAAETKETRGIAVAANLIGNIWLKRKQIDSALAYQYTALDIASENQIYDVELLCYSGLGAAMAAQGNKDIALKTLRRGFDLAAEKPVINNLFYTLFLDEVAAVYEQYDDREMMLFTANKKLASAKDRIRRNDEQMNTMLKESLKNETRLLNMEVQEARQKQKNAYLTLGLLIVLVVFLFIAFLIYRYSQKQKMKVAFIRQKISQDLHDDIGASLSSLQIYGTIAAQTFDANPQKTREMIEKIVVQSNAVMENMDDIVWSMERTDSHTTSLAAKIKNYGSELLNDKNISFSYDINPQVEGLLQSIHARKNMVLIIKEAMNNIAKYSQANQATLSIDINGKNIVLNISDDGIGFDASKINDGNGLKNMQQRMKEMKGSLDIKSQKGKGTNICGQFPVAYGK